MDIQDIRRRNLATWLETHSVPPKEKSLFSQLKAGGSFGEKVARRLEVQYGMGEPGFLDRIEEVNSSIRGQNPPLSAAAKMLIESIERIDRLGDPTRKIFPKMAGILEIAELLNVPHNQQAKPSMAEIDEADEFLTEEQARVHTPRVRNHATTRKRETK